MTEEFEKNEKSEECGYCRLTIIALIIAIFSALLTLAIASFMYHGVHDSYPIMPKEIMSSSMKRLLVPHKKVIILKMEAKNRCYILPIHLSQNLANTKLSFLNIALSHDLLFDVAGEDGVDFCATTPAYILEKDS
ncbi:unnamed protein product [Caenorhabditis angaria]|uniref:Uncharacterized protein n=1 Tax=Caenorhabditis angaria TaxID=860376 RepID=A0A9P1IXC3_9PELO|nr:unnamed protein product [Caenorhabditis angaria]